MSLARTALRLAAIAALETHPVIAACCPGRIFDSRVGDFNHREPVPVIIVTTEELHGEPFNPQNGGEPFNDHCDLVLEIAMTQFVEGEGGDAFLYRPETDRELEAALDLLEECASLMITLGRPAARFRPTAAGALLQKAVVRRVTKRTSARFASDQTGEKLAIHLLTFRVELKGEAVDMRAPPTGEFALLPDPLRSVAASLAADSSGYATCQLIAEQLALLTAPVATLSQTSVAPPIDPTQQVPGTLPVAISFPISEDP